VDCWDGKDNDPIIYHGHTLTSKIRFRDVIQCIKESAIVKSPYPIILSLETHCCEEQQNTMADIMIEIFGDLLVLPTQIDNGSITKFPSPNELKNKIVIKGKRCSNIEEDDDTDSDGDFESLDKEETTEWYQVFNEAPPTESKRGSKSNTKRKSSKHKTSKKLSDITFLAAQSYKNELAKEWFKMHSFSETKLERFYKSDTERLIQFNRTNFSRIYPKGTRFASTNYDPIPSWATGCQMVSMNYQTDDRYMRLNNIKFEQNGHSGYILKPERIRTGTCDFLTARPTHRVTITIISAEHIPKQNESTKGEVIDPFVKIMVYGPDPDCHYIRTQPVINNGFNPVWNEQCELDIHHMDLSMLRLGVYDKNNMEKDAFLCENVLPINQLRPGLRCVPLRSTAATVIEACHLLVKIEINDYTEFSNQPIAIIEELARLREENKRLRAQSDSSPSKGRKRSNMIIKDQPESGKDLSYRSPRSSTADQSVQTNEEVSAISSRSPTEEQSVQTVFLEPPNNTVSSNGDMSRGELEERTRKLEEQMDEMLKLFKTVNDNLYREPMYSPTNRTKLTEVPVDTKWNSILPLCKDQHTRAIVSRLARVNISLSAMAMSKDADFITGEVERSMNDVTQVIDAVIAGEPKDEKKTIITSLKRGALKPSIGSPTTKGKTAGDRDSYKNYRQDKI
jgi:hypothetical protein